MNNAQLRAMRLIAGSMKKEDKMSGPEFHQTGYGRRFFDAQLPQLIKAIEEMASNVAECNRIIREEITLTNVQVDGKAMSEYIEAEALRILNRALDKVD